MPKLVEAVRALVRPVITATLVASIVLMVLMSYTVPDRYWNLVELVVGWWFISRNGNKANGQG